MGLRAGLDIGEPTNVDGILFRPLVAGVSGLPAAAGLAMALEFSTMLISSKKTASRPCPFL